MKTTIWFVGGMILCYLLMIMDTPMKFLLVYGSVFAAGGLVGVVTASWIIGKRDLVQDGQ